MKTLDCFIFLFLKKKKAICVGRKGRESGEKQTRKKKIEKRKRGE